MNTDIIARWRDAITDPPPDGWRGLIRNPDEGDRVWFRDFKGKHYPGDQWLDVTDVPAVAVAKVQAAVDEMDARRITAGNEACACGYDETDHFSGMEDGFDAAEDIILKHTGVDAPRGPGIMPSEVHHDR